MYARILITTDGSELAEKGLSKGLELAAQLGAQVDIVTVSEPWAVGMYDAMGWSAGYEASDEYKQDREDAAQKILQDELPIVYLYNQTVFFAMRSNLQGFAINPDGIIRLAGMKRS